MALYHSPTPYILSSMPKKSCRANISKSLKLNPPRYLYSSINPMSTQSDASPPSRATMSCIANFQPGICGDGFVNCHSLDHMSHAHMQEQIDQLKILVREVFTSTACGLSHMLKSIDDIQRLGVSYHFETEIEEALEYLLVVQLNDSDQNLYNESLRFRLLRQHGYYVSPGDIFNKFKDATGHFKKSLATDVMGMLSLYEATHLRIHGEDILEEALVFTTKHLELAISQESYPLTEKISQALKIPVHRRVQKLSAREYIPIYQATNSHNEALLKLAKIDFNLIQSLYKEELKEVTSWWKEQDFERNIPVVRHRLVECYFGTVGMYYEPQYSVARKIGARLCAMATMLDDMFDTCTMYEQVKILREAIDSWDVNYCLDGVPRYMRVYYHALLKLMNEIEEVLEKQGVSYRVHYAKQVFKDQARDYLVEAKWLHEGSIPSMEEYIPVRVPSSGACLTIVISLLGMGDTIPKETFEWLWKYPKIVWAPSLMFRLMDDIQGRHCEKQIGDAVSSIECYMKQYGVSEEETIDVFNEQIDDAWKDVNEALLRPIVVPKPVLMTALNFARNIALFYNGEDGFKGVGKAVKHGVHALFVNPLAPE